MTELHEPKSAKARLNKETICDVHRDVYHFVKTLSNLTDDEKAFIQQRIEVAFKMGKSMDAKLRQYKDNYDENWWDTARKAWDWDELKK